MTPLHGSPLPDDDRARTRHMLRAGILFFALPTFTIACVWRWYDTYGWHAAPANRLRFELVKLLIGLALWTTGGYFFARRMWYEGHRKAMKHPAVKS